MKLRENRNSKFCKSINEMTITGRILNNKDNVEFGDELYAIYPFNAEPLIPLTLEVSTNQYIEADDGSRDCRKHIIPVNVYGELIEEILQNKNIYVGSRVSVTGYFISKNFAKTQEKLDISNIFNRYKNLNNGIKPISYVGDKLFKDTATGVSYEKCYIDWNELMAYELVTEIPEEEEQDAGKVEYFAIEDGRVFRQEFKTNYILIAKEVTLLDDFKDTNESDTNSITLSGTGKDIYVSKNEGYDIGHICLVCKSEDMTRYSYFHIVLRGKNLEALNSITTDDFIKVEGKVKHRVLSKEIVKKKGKKELVFMQYTNIYEIDCKKLDIYKK